ncbi:MAG: 1-(5-phosphoribosyl)-5-[(5-phosphoribosylamino)methylideneamino]imidazole-4-carboxamide isomerase [Chloroflexota bacterium]
MSFEIYPAIDLRNGKVVRLEYGDPDRQTKFSDDPAATGRRWLDAGAGWVHVVNLDGAFDEQGAANWRALESLTALGALIQFGGGMRTMDDVARAMDLGVQRVVLGTAAIENPDLVAAVIDRFGGERLAIGLDARDGTVKTHGWRTETGMSVVELGREMRAAGAKTAVYTDISRDGVLTGVNVEASASLAEKTGLEVIASGGVSSLEDIRRLLEYRTAGMGGVIIGRALYDDRIDLAEAIALAGGA